MLLESAFDQQWVDTYWLEILASSLKRIFMSVEIIRGGKDSSYPSMRVTQAWWLYGLQAVEPDNPTQWGEESLLLLVRET